MKRISEKEALKVLKTMENQRIEITVKGAIDVKQIISELEYNTGSGVIELKNKETGEYTRVNLNEAYCTMTNKNRSRIQANIDSLNNDTIVVIEKL